MRRVTRASERGGISVLVAILMVVLLGFAAIAIDVGKLYSEHTQLQNGADAAALLVAQKCAKNGPGGDCSETSSLAGSVANQNALDGASNIHYPIGLNMEYRTVRVTVGAKETGNSLNSVSLLFARVFGVSSAQMTAKSSVAWGSPVKGTAPFPLAFSICQVSGMVGGVAQLIQDYKSHANTDCSLGPGGTTVSGSTVSGGFGWLLQSSGQCGAWVNLAEKQSGSDTGKDGPSNCDAVLKKWAAEHAAGRPVTVLLPVYNAVSGTGAGASYTIVAFAAIRVRGWKFKGDSALPLVYNNAPATGPQCTGDCRGIIGTFVRYVSLTDGYTLGPVNPYGATVVELTE